MPRINGSQSTRIFQWMRLPTILTSENPPVLNTYKEILSYESGPFKALHLYLKQTNTEAAAKDITLEFKSESSTTGTLTVEDTVSLTHNVDWYAYPDYMPVHGSIGLKVIDAVVAPFAVYGSGEFWSSMKLGLRIKMISALGTAQTLVTNLVYSKWNEVI